MRTPDSWHQAQATVVIALLIGLAYLIVSGFGIEQAAYGAGAFFASDWGSAFSLPRSLLSPLTATLLHAGLLHLLFNLLIFAFCGRAVEGAVGPVGLVILFVVGAFAAAAGQFLADPASPYPMVGASGAISAVIGAYAMLFGRNRVPVANASLALWLNVLWLLVAWIVLQTAMGIVLGAGSGLMLAVGAHIGGFVAGLILARPLLLWRYRRA